MNDKELDGQYHRLRRQLDDAYTAPIWDSLRIDRIAEALLPVERALAARQPPAGAWPAPLA